MARIETRKDQLGRGRRVDKEARFQALCKQWDASIGAFRCYFTGLPLNELAGSRRSATWEHLVPGDESSVVLVSDLVNKMKSDMTLGEFRRLVQALARHFEGGDFDESAFPADRPATEEGMGSETHIAVELDPSDRHPDPDVD